MVRETYRGDLFSKMSSLSFIILRGARSSPRKVVIYWNSYAGATTYASYGYHSLQGLNLDGRDFSTREWAFGFSAREVSLFEFCVPETNRNSASAIVPRERADNVGLRTQDPRELHRGWGGGGSRRKSEEKNQNAKRESGESLIFLMPRFLNGSA